MSLLVVCLFASIVLVAVQSVILMRTGKRLLALESALMERWETSQTEGC